MKHAFLKDSHMITPLGFSTEENFSALRRAATGLQPTFINASVGEIIASTIDEQQWTSYAEEQKIDLTRPKVVQWCIAALAPILQRHPLRADSLLILSTTKGNIAALEDNDIEGADINLLAAEIAQYFHFNTEPIIVSNACVSGVMALSVAKRFLEAGLASDTYVIGVDQVTPFIASGFQSFQALSPVPCRPYDADREGLNLGEGAAAAYISTNDQDATIRIAGDANINDANHISGPSRTGEGLFQSIEKAFSAAGISADEVDLICAHGTATRYNDEMESIAFARHGLHSTPVHSLKGYFGHTLGLSGLLETLLTAKAMEENILIPSLGYNTPGTSEALNVIQEQHSSEIRVALKTASGFGGSNSALVLLKKT